MNIIRIWNENRKLVWYIFGMIVFGILIIQLLNSLVKEQNSKEEESIAQNNIYYFKNNTITGKTNQDIYNSTIHDFIENCIQGQLQLSYDMLSNNCKEEKFPTLKDFIEKYYNIEIKDKQLFSIEKILDTRYRITMKTDMLSTGTTEIEEKKHIISLIQEDGKEKIEVVL